MKVIPYMMFDGNAEEALTYYQYVFDAKEPNIMRYSDGPSDELPIPDSYKNKVLHAELSFGDNLLYLSDNFPDQTTSYGDGLTLNLMIESELELATIFNKLSEGGQIIQPLEEQFWGSIFGTVDDKYGFHWSLNYDLPKT